MSQAASTVEVPAKAPAAEASGAAIVQDAGVSSAGNSAANLGSDGQQHARVTVLVETVGDSGVVATAHPVLQWLGWLIKPWVRLVTALPGDIMSLRWYEAVFLVVFGCVNVIFSFVDANPDAPSRNKIDNVMAMSMVPERDRVYLTLSGAASFTGAVSVIFASKGRYSNYSFGIINSTLFGLFAWAFGYGGDAQMNLIFFNILQVFGMYMWSAKAALDASATARVRSLNLWQWALVLAGAAGLAAAFYFEIPAFTEHLNGPGTYFYPDIDGKPATPHMLDSVSNALNFVSQLLLLNRFLEQWLLWITIDCIQLAMFSGTNGFPPDANTLIMYIFFLLNALYGFYLWINRYRAQRLADAAAANATAKAGTTTTTAVAADAIATDAGVKVPVAEASAAAVTPAADQSASAVAAGGAGEKQELVSATDAKVETAPVVPEAAAVADPAVAGAAGVTVADVKADVPTA